MSGPPARFFSVTLRSVIARRQLNNLSKDEVTEIIFAKGKAARKQYGAFYQNIGPFSLLPFPCCVSLALLAPRLAPTSRN